MFQYKLELRPPGLDAATTTVSVKGIACCGHSLSEAANNIGVLFDSCHNASVNALYSVAHDDEHGDEPQVPDPS